MITPTGTLVAETCDAHASGSTAAAVVVHTKAGPLYLCAHDFRKYEAQFVAAEYDVEWIDTAMQIHPLSAPTPPVPA
jgi:hypothetical protein